MFISKRYSEKIIKKTSIGTIGTHVHSSPTRDDRFALDDFEFVREYEEVGFDGVVIKCHEFATFFRSKIAQKYAVKSS